MSNATHVVLMAGGSGTRFWPLSRVSRPKQFLPIGGPDTMIARTVARVAELVPMTNTWVVCGESQVPLVRETLPELPAGNVLAEPCGRNTLPCVALASRALAERDPDSVQIVLPADHVIEPRASFLQSLRAGIEVARRDEALVTFGIRPTFPATGYGYIELGGACERARGTDVYEVERFVEKPELERAREFLASRRFLWNSGMFVWTTRAIEAALVEYAPALHTALAAATPATLPEVYAGLDSVPVDKGILERASHRRVLPIDYSWSDVGSWSALDEVLEADQHGTYLDGSPELVTHEAKNCIVHGEAGHTIALVGVEDLIVVQTPDATLVCPRDRAQDVRAIVDELKRRESPRR